MQYPGLCLEQVCLLKYLPCHTCVSWIQSCGIILVPVHTSWSYPRRCPVTPRTGGAALAAGTAPLPHDPRDRQTDRQRPCHGGFRALVLRGPTQRRDKQETSSRAGRGHCRETGRGGLHVSFSFLLCAYYQQILNQFMPNRHAEDLL